ncbi:MAG: radical SAM protein [Candidatus Heimdallarchaeota archaeon]
MQQCVMRQQGFDRGSCLVSNSQGSKLACQATLKRENGEYSRLITSMHLSRPEDYFSIYQSGCNHTCLKCHSHTFSQVTKGDWISTSQLAEILAGYAEDVTVYEPKERSTMYHAGDLCRHCGLCIQGLQHPWCPQMLEIGQVVLSPQGWGPARNIAAFTGGDIVCQAEYYAEATKQIKDACDVWVLIETNGYGLTDENLEILKAGGVDSFWLDIKAYGENVYRKLCGTTNSHILTSVQRAVDAGFVLEVLTLFIPTWVETDQHHKIAELIAETDPSLPTTLLAFFPYNMLKEVRSPTLHEMVQSFLVMKEAGLKNLRLGNVGVFARTERERDFLVNLLGERAIG